MSTCIPSKHIWIPTVFLPSLICNCHRVSVSRPSPICKFHRVSVSILNVSSFICNCNRMNMPSSIYNSDRVSDLAAMQVIISQHLRLTLLSPVLPLVFSPPYFSPVQQRCTTTSHQRSRINLHSFS